MLLLKLVTASEGFKILSVIPSKTSVLDCVLTSVFKLCPSLLSDLIAHLANLSFSRGVFPSKFKHASVSTILKKPNLDPSELANYWPVFNLNNISKILERLFLTCLQPHITIVHQTSIHYNQHIGATSQPRHLLFIAWNLSIMLLMMVLRLYFLPLISVQPSIPSIILLSSSVFLTALVLWA